MIQQRSFKNYVNTNHFNEIFDAEELIKYNKEDQNLINEQNINKKLKKQSSALNNAREIRKVMIQVMSHILIEKL